MRFLPNQVQRRYVTACLRIALISNLIYFVLAPILNELFGVNDLKLMYLIGHTCTTLISSLAALAATRNVLAIEAANDHLARQSVELKAAKVEADRATQAKSDFLAMISHEVRTPLNGVLGLAQILRNRPLSAEDADLAQKIHLSGEALLEILNDILDLSKIESGELQISPTSVDLHHEVNRVHELFAPLAAEKGLKFSVNFDTDVPRLVELDPVRVRQCLSNLISNALKFTSHGSVAIQVSCNGGAGVSKMIRICVTDTGIGIADGAQDRIFEPFSQADASTNRTYGGTGLGLPITRQLAENMGGALRLISSNAASGSVFEVSFTVELSSSEISTSLAPSPDMPTPQTVDFSGLSFLVVDDIATNRLVLSTLLSDMGAQITEANDGSEALRAMEAHRFDLVFLDVHMPELTGPEVLTHMRNDQRLAHIPAIVTTAETMIGDRDRFMEMGMDGYVSKPIDMQLLCAEASKVLKQRSSE